LFNQAGTEVGNIEYVSSSLRFDVNEAEAMRIDSSQRVGIGTDSPSGVNVYEDAKLAVVGVGFSDQPGITVTGYVGAGSTGVSPKIALQRTATTTDGSVTALDANEWRLGEILFRGSAGSNFQTGASIGASNDSEVYSASNSPGILSFRTTSSGSTIPSERMRIDNKGHVGLNIAPQEAFHVANPTSEQSVSTIDIPYSWNSTSTGTFEITIRANTGTTQRGLMFVELEIGGSNDVSYVTYQVLKCRIIVSNNASDAAVTVIREEDKASAVAGDLSVSAAHAATDTTTITVSGWATTVDHRLLKIKATARNFIGAFGFTQN